MSQPLYPEQFLVLGAGLYESGYPKPETVERAQSMFHYFDEHGATRVVFSGGHSIHEPETGGSSSEAKIMADIAVDHGLPAEIIDLEEDSTSTYTNFINSEPLLTSELTGVLTHGRHMKRALFIGRRVLEVPLIGIESMGITKEDGLVGRAARFAFARVLLSGIAPGEIDKVSSRISRAEQTLATFGPVLRGSMRRLHNT